MGKRILAQRRGRRSPQFYAPSHRYKSDVRHPPLKNAVGEVIDIVHDPGHTAPLALVQFKVDNKIKKYYMLAHDGMRLHQKIYIGEYVPLSLGNTMPIGNIPEGSHVYNIEAKPGDGGKFVRAAGTSSVIFSHHGGNTTIQFPSGQTKTISSKCRATIGTVAGGGRKDRPFAKAGKKYHALRSTAKKYPRTKGVSMDPVDHPHGGGGHRHVGKPSTVSRHAWPGRKVGRLSSKKKKRKV